MDGSAAPASLQRSSHADLIELITPAPAGKASASPDAIIVPAARSHKNLTTAIDLAQAADCRLVVLCSLRTRPDKVRSLFDARGFAKGTAVDVPSGYALPSPRLETTDWVKRGTGAGVCGGRESDLSAKRNVGLLLARMLGWQRIFFLDDDIRGITADDLTCTVSLLDRGFESAGMQVKHFPDNSVVCHARREVKEDQDVFVSGSVLAVDTAAPFAFFPDIYNEDWLFFYQDVAKRRMATPGLLATVMEQMSYNPFANPKRAAKEEFGDVIAEGLYSLLHDDRGPEFATREHWQRFLGDRTAILDVVCGQLDKAPPERRDEIATAIDTARETLAKIDPEMCIDYLATWQLDLLRWEKLLLELPLVSSVEVALRQLGLRAL